MKAMPRTMCSGGGELRLGFSATAAGVVDADMSGCADRGGARAAVAAEIQATGCVDVESHELDGCKGALPLQANYSSD